MGKGSSERVRGSEKVNKFLFTEGLKFVGGTRQVDQLSHRGIHSWYVSSVPGTIYGNRQGPYLSPNLANKCPILESDPKYDPQLLNLGHYGHYLRRRRNRRGYIYQNRVVIPQIRSRGVILYLYRFLP